MAFGVLTKMYELIEEFKPTKVIMAFDYSGRLLRQEVSEEYKESRRKKYAEATEEEKEIRADFKKQVVRLQREILPAAGFNNILSLRGYEADDIIAHYAQELPEGWDAVIISGDADLYQCLSYDVRFLSPYQKKGVYSYSDFVKEWGISPHDWVRVKALAGCKSDDVIGVKGIGEKTAVKWLKNDLKKTSKKFKDIEENLDVLTENLKLVKLPFPGIEEVLPKLRKDDISQERREAVYTSLGISTEMLEAVPGARSPRPGRAGVSNPSKALQRKRRQEKGGFQI